MSDFTQITGNPVPELAEAFYYSDLSGRRLRGMFAPAPSKFANARGTVILSPGYTEFIEKYFEVTRDLQARGFAVVCFDWPGQGMSERLLRNPLSAHIDHFDDFVSALVQGMNVISRRLSGPTVLLAHSMGGAIGLEALRQNALDVDAAAFNAPMWRVKLPPLGNAIVNIMCGIGAAKSAALPHDIHPKFKGNKLTHDEDRWQRPVRCAVKTPELALGSPTWGWLKAAIEVNRGFFVKGALDHISIPVLVVSASDEQLVVNKAHSEVASRIKSAEHVMVEGAKHEVLMEENSKRDQFWHAFDALLDRAKI